MLRHVAFLLAPALAAALTTVECSELGAVGCQPSWVKHFNTPSGVAAFGGPEQLWINYGATYDAITFGWVTSNMTAGSIVQYGIASGQYTNNAAGNATFYTYSSSYTSGLIHHVWATGLSLNTTYFYRVGDASAWSAEYSFKSNPGATQYPYTFAFLADIGESAAANQTITHILSTINEVDSVIINGDISYASGCESSGCTVWDAFQRMAQPVAAVKPWAINIGNHELDDYANGIYAISSQYRFAGMPFEGRSDGVLYFSYNAGPVHVISACSFYPGGFAANSPLTQWLQADLAAVDRSITPWILVSVHAPWYNSNSDHQGNGEPMREAFEALFVQYKVAAMFSGHVHAYERSYPVINDGTIQPAGKGISHFNIGDAGASLYTTWLTQPSWSAFRSAEYGHGQFQIINATHAYWGWHRNADAEPVLADEVYVINPYIASSN